VGEVDLRSVLAAVSQELESELGEGKGLKTLNIAGPLSLMTIKYRVLLKIQGFSPVWCLSPFGSALFKNFNLITFEVCQDDRHKMER